MNFLYKTSEIYARRIKFEMDDINKEQKRMKNELQTTIQSLNKVDDIGGPLLGK